ncbi:MAG: sulfatase-like hydrolase/transferase [Candidatus Zipacnadales bacterium]
MTDTRPNIIVYFTDQQRWDTCGCYGQPLPVTPNLDWMAEKGTRFALAFTCQPVCGPARSCLQTGRYATEVGCFRNDIALPTNEKTIAHWFAEAGYEVGYIGKWHLASTGLHANFRTRAVPPERRGGYKDYWLASDVLEFTSHGYNGHLFDADGNRVDFTGYRVDGVTDFVLEYLRTRDGSRPFFLFASYIEPHHQNDHNRYEGPRGSQERWSDYEVPGDLVDTHGDWRENFPDYLGCCWSLDYNLGRVRAELELLGLAQNTLIIYTSDHGSHFRTRNNEYKRCCHDGCLRIPLVAWGPGFVGGGVVEELVSLIDLPPTLLAAGGIEIPATMHGRPLQSLLQTNAANWPPEVFAQISESQVGRCIRTRRWKYSVSAPDKRGWSDPQSDIYVEDFLYDLEADPHERINLVRDPTLADIRAELAEILKGRMAEAGESVPVILPAPGS